MDESALQRFLKAIYRSARIEGPNHTTLAGSFLGKSHQHLDLYQMSYIVNGRTDVIIAGRRYRVGDGHVLWVPPKTWHGSCRPDECKRLDLAQTKFTVSMCPPFRFPAVMIVQTPNEWLNLFQQLINEYHMQRPYRETTIRLLFAQLVLLMARNLTGNVRRRTKASQPNRSPSVQQARINAAVRYLHQHYRDHVKLADVARAVAMSVSALSHGFRRLTGLSPINYLINYRLSQAVVLMGNTEMKVGTIAEAVGFASPYYFYRQFKKRYHVSPGQYYRRVYPAP
ncbi:MAG: AraC family transcriptional regulator [Verrucomicrobia bacterium]|nr:AraC family transcriptional regulator [Verrucomicrobiota bacterium]MBU1736038.1 AraC family transcriptional regulator [Verrucomicrobiota bacterium]MBU1855822.1 AraC family transcriptional regulator [Verrucomicrobiota bacterium]